MNIQIIKSPFSLTRSIGFQDEKWLFQSPISLGFMSSVDSFSNLDIDTFRLEIVAHYKSDLRWI